MTTSAASAQRRPLANPAPSIPAPVAYHPNERSTMPQMRDAGFSLRSKSEKGTSTMLFDRHYSTPPELGPGSYNAEALPGGGRSTIAGEVAGAKKLGRSGSFRSESVRDLNGAFFAHEPFY